MLTIFQNPPTIARRRHGAARRAPTPAARVSRETPDLCATECVSRHGAQNSAPLASARRSRPSTPVRQPLKWRVSLGKIAAFRAPLPPLPPLNPEPRTPNPSRTAMSTIVDIRGRQILD